MVKLLEKKVADVKLPAGRGCGVVGLKFFGKVDFERQGNLVVVCSLLIIAAAEAPNQRGSSVIPRSSECLPILAMFFVVVFLPFLIPSWTK